MVKEALIDSSFFTLSSFGRVLINVEQALLRVLFTPDERPTCGSIGSTVRCQLRHRPKAIVAAKTCLVDSYPIADGRTDA